MFDDSHAFVTRPFLRAELDLEYRGFAGSDADQQLLARLREWNQRTQLSETQAEGAFIQTFFVDTWGYGDSGRVAADQHTLIPKFRITGEGAGGGSGEADLALGWFRGKLDETPQVLCEFKDIKSKLDAKQNRKGSNRSPVEQCLAYVRGARRGMIGNEPVLPWWGLVTDMNEFRLYWWDRAPNEYLRFTIKRDADLFAGEYDLLDETEDACFDRFLFWKLLQRDYLLSPAGRPPLLRLIEKQWIRERALEGEFYDHYRGVRERLFNVLRLNNPDFDGTATDLLRMSQALLDRFIFAFYCEDMGERMLFPPQMIRDLLKSRSIEPHYDPDGDDYWSFFKRLFAMMNSGGNMGPMKVPHINGGLFAANPKMDGLIIPNHIFAAAGQGAAGEAVLEQDPRTLLYLSARYNYAAHGGGKDSLSLYTLGRIFEQSITELEFRAGELEQRDTVAKLNKRKRDGVYYTPEWVVNLLVEEAMKPWMDAAKLASGYPEDEAIAPGRASVDAYRERLRAMSIVDPACGSGAFLISAFRRILHERVEVERELRRADGGTGAGNVDETPLIADILARNIYGVDINPASVEITKLALWLHSARADAPLSSLDNMIRCGNSLVSDDFWREGADRNDRFETINSFNWAEKFPEVWNADGEGGFDIVLGNPPYVKLQNLMKVDPDVVAYLQADRGEDTYVSAQTGNTDLYLPFIEKGLRLLAPGGRMAYIAPSLWAVNQYGEGLRRLVKRTRQLDRWLDFKAHQIFEEATTYTALQFFTHDPNDKMRIATAPNGDSDAQDVDWHNEDLEVDYADLPEDGEWLMATGAERALIHRLGADCLRLDDPKVTSAIYQGLITSADSIYHLKRLGDGRYLCSPKGDDPYEVRIEDKIMKPLISGPEAKRYQEPSTDTYLLFPYARNAGGAMGLISEANMVDQFPQAWAYLRSWEAPLRARESSRFNDATWYRFGRNQNVDIQDKLKLVVAQTVPNLRVTADNQADKYLNNVRVNGILAAKGVDQNYLLGVLNGQVADFVFRRIGRPKQGGWFEANKQFIAPLPVPNASPEARDDIAARARDLQGNWTGRRDLLAEAADRLSVLARSQHPARWLWPDLPDLPDMIDRAPAALTLATEKRAWADNQLAEMEAARLAELQAALELDAQLDVGFTDGELKLSAGGMVVLSQIFLDEPAGRLAEAYWRYMLLWRDWREAKLLAGHLRRPPAPVDTPAARQFIQRVDLLAAETQAIDVAEREMNDRLFELYNLTPAERLLVENAKK